MPKRVSTAQIKTVIDNRGGHRTSQVLDRRTPGQCRDASTITVRVPLSTQQRGIRKLVISPPGQPDWAAQQTRIDDTLIKAIARAHRWNRMLEVGEFTSVTELAMTEGVTESYLARILRLTLLSPKVVEAVLGGRSDAVPQLQQLIRPIPLVWEKQERAWLGAELVSTR